MRLPKAAPLCLFLCLVPPAFLEAQDRSLPAPTLGGKQFWSDHLVLHDWRIQRNVLTRRFRLLDDRDRRRAGGSFENCRDVLEELKREKSITPVGPRVVLVLHGLGRSRKSMAGLVKYLRENSDFTVLNVSYASTQQLIGQHAKVLRKVIGHLPAAREINFVAHSMGNLVIRHYVADLLADNGPAARGQLDRMGRMVMLAPPNRGAKLADRFENNHLFRLLWGVSGQQIAEWETLAPLLAIPPGEFGILAAGNGDEGRNPFVDGDDDFVVSVEETRLAGARDFLVVSSLHAVIMDDSEARAATLRFLRNGHFIAADRRQPIDSAEGLP